jgi:hypothetical protein
MFLTIFAALSVFHSVSAAVTPITARNHTATPVNTTICNGQKYIYQELAGWGFLPGDARDKYGDTIGGIGSAIALDKKSWTTMQGKSEAYQGIIYGLPDRGWNTQGTQNTQSRIHKFSIALNIVSPTLQNPAAPNFNITYLDTILLTSPDGQPVTGLDADPTGSISYKGFPDLPVATCKFSSPYPSCRPC